MGLVYCGNEEGETLGGEEEDEEEEYGGGVHRFAQRVGGRIVAGMAKCVNQLLPVSFIKRTEAPCGEGNGRFHCGNYNLKVFHYQLFICCENSAAFSLVIAPRDEKLSWEVSVSM